MSSIAMFHGELVWAFIHEGDQRETGAPMHAPTVTVYPGGGSARRGHVSVIWNLTIDEAVALELELELGQALASVRGEGEGRP